MAAESVTSRQKRYPRKPTWRFLHALVNRTEFLSESGVILVGVGDHHLIYLIRKRDKKGGGRKHYEIKTRNF